MKSWIVPWIAAMYIVMGRITGMEENIVLDNCCQISEFTDMEYYILCETEKNVGVSDIEQYYAIYGGGCRYFAAGTGILSEIQRHVLCSR